MLTERQYRIDKYIELARLTRIEEKKELFIDNAQYYLELEDYDFGTKAIEDNSLMDSYFKDMTADDFVGKASKDCYQEYFNFCKQASEKAMTQTSFSRHVNKTFGLATKKVRRGHETPRTFYKN